MGNLDTVRREREERKRCFFFIKERRAGWSAMRNEDKAERLRLRAIRSRKLAMHELT